MDEEKIIILVQGHQCLYNLQHKDYDNNLVKDNFWKEIVGELHAKGKELSAKDTALSENGRVEAGERHGMCESALKGPNLHLLAALYDTSSFIGSPHGGTGAIMAVRQQHA
jgi:hypothetical protein